MGQRMEDIPIEYGVDCPLVFGVGETPKYLYARFSNIVTCPGALFIAPNDRTFKLTQVVGQPCWWSLIIPGSWVITFRYTAGPVRSQLILSQAPNFLYFTGTENIYTDEGHVFHNTQVACAGFVHGIEGIAVVTWTPQATELLAAINLAKGYDLFMELWPLDDGKLVYKFCRLKELTNIKILFEP